MRLKTLEINGFKSFPQKTILEFNNSIVCIVGPNGSGKSNVVEAIRYVLGEQSMKSMRGKTRSDLIFKGSKNLPKGTRATVTIYFSNPDKIFKLSNETGENINLNYETISISRQVFPDGLNKYILNGTEVRMKDIHNLSQDETDRILNANPKERREMVEDALGLKIYQYKIKESERKLERTENNMKEVTLKRRENAPHLNFLKKQIEKLEKSKQLKEELLTLYKWYLKNESIYLKSEKTSLENEKKKINSELSVLKSKIGDTEETDITTLGGGSEKIRQLEQKLREIRSIKSELERKLGRIEGTIEVKEERNKYDSEEVMTSPVELKKAFEAVVLAVDEALAKNNISEIKSILDRIKNILSNLSKKNR